MAVFAAAQNYAHDPRPVANTRFAVTGSATASFVTDRSYSGTGSVFLTLPSAGEVSWSAAADDDGDISPLTGVIRAMAHYSGASNTGLEARLRLKYTDNAFTDSAYISLTNTGTSFERLIFGDLTKNPAKTLRSIIVHFRNVSGATRTVYVGGFDARNDQPIDGFIHGSAGPAYSWLGTTNNSPSSRADITVGRVVGVGGMMRPSILIETTNRQGIPINDITDHFIDGSIAYDLDADRHKGTLNITLDDPHLVQAFADQYIRVTLRIERLGGLDEEGSVGMFMVDPPSERWLSGSNDQWSYSGKDMLGLLDTWMMRRSATGNTFVLGPLGTVDPALSFNSPEYQAADGYVVVAGRSYQAVVDELLRNHVGLSASQYAIVVPGSFQSGMSWRNNETALRVLSDILEAGGMQKPWVTPYGIITTEKAGVNPATQIASYTFRTGEDSPVRWPFEVDADVSKVGNRVRCTSTYQATGTHRVTISDAIPATTGPDPEWPPNKPKKKKAIKKWKKLLAAGDPGIVIPPVAAVVDETSYQYWGPVEAFAVNLDPAHPLSVPRLGRYIDLPDINFNMLLTTANAEAKAKQALLEASKIPIKARMTTEVMLRGLGEVYLLDLMDSDGNPIASGQGKYACRGWTLQLGAPWEMIHTLTRVVEYSQASWS